MLKQGSSRLLLSLDDLRKFDADLARALLPPLTPHLCVSHTKRLARNAGNLMKRPAEYLPSFEEALREVCIATPPPSRASPPPSPPHVPPPARAPSHCPLHAAILFFFRWCNLRILPTARCRRSRRCAPSPSRRPPIAAPSPPRRPPAAVRAHPAPCAHRAVPPCDDCRSRLEFRAPLGRTTSHRAA